MNDADTLPSSLEPDVSQRLDSIWAKAYAAEGQSDLLKLYEEWSETYDQDHEAIGFFGHRAAAEILHRYTPSAQVAAVLDAGCGTGAAGDALSALGFKNLTGVDLSPAMLERAAQKGTYRHLESVDLGQPLDSFPRDSFDAAVLVGVFSFGQAPAHALEEIVRLVKPGGVVAFTMRVDFFEQDAMGVRSKLEELEQAHAWKLVELTEPAQYLPGKDPEALFRVWCYRVLETKTPPVDELFAAEVREAFTLGDRVKPLDHAYIWNATGSRLYDRYTECPGYYLTDCEVEILKNNAGEILGEDETIIELGSGSAKKASFLLQAAVDHGRPCTYIPVDVSDGAIEATRSEVVERFGHKIEVVPRIGRFDDVLATIPVGRKVIVCFGGSIGNLHDLETTVEFLRTIRSRMSPGDRFVVGIDLMKDEQVLRDAYEAGQPNRNFFLNMVRRMNNELGANFDLSAFRQESPIEPDEPYRGLATRSVRFHLISERAQAAYIQAMHMEVGLREGDAIEVGASRKFEPDEIRRLAELAGLELGRQWFDARSFFSLNEFVLAPS